MNRNLFLVVLSLLAWTAGVSSVRAQGTAFLYQGRLNDAGAAANGNYDFRFTIFTDVTNGSAISLPVTNSAVPVSNGLFSVTLDFGPGVFSGSNYWLDLGVRAVGAAGFTALLPRQPILPVPYAMFANTASNFVGSLSVTQLVGALKASQLSGTYTGLVSFTSAANSFSGSFNGNGGNLTNLNAAQLASGTTVADARLTTNVALLNRDQTFTGSNTFNGTNFFNGVNTFTNRGNSFIGNFFGNGLVGWIPVSGTATQAMPNAGYLLLSPNLTTVTLPTTANLLVGDIVRISGAGVGGWKIAQNAGQSIAGIFLSPSNTAWAVSTANGLYGWNGIASSADGMKMVTVSSSGGILLSSDGGKVWGSPNSGSYMASSVASSADGMKLAAASASGSIVVSTNFGSTWNTTDAPNLNWQSIAGSSDGTKLVAVVNGGRIYTSVNSGKNWTLQGNSLSAAWFSVAASADGSKLAAAIYGNYLYTSTDSGVNWTQRPNSTAANWTAITSSADGTKLAAAVYGGKIYTSTDSGATWTQQANAPTAYWYAINSSSDGQRLIAAVNGGNGGSAGGIYVSANGGQTWTKQPVADQKWTGIACSADGTKIAAAYATLTTAGGVYYWQANILNTITTVGVGGFLTGSQGAAVELQHIGNGAFMPVSQSGNFWAN